MHYINIINMITLKDINIDVKNISAIEYHFENEDLNIEIQNPSDLKIIDKTHIITDETDCIFIIENWVYISIIPKTCKNII
jgi:hypothetical protein